MANNRFSKEYMIAATRLVLTGGKSTTETAKNLGMNPSILYSWVAKYRSEVLDTTTELSPDDQLKWLLGEHEVDISPYLIQSAHQKPSVDKRFWRNVTLLLLGSFMVAVFYKVILPEWQFILAMLNPSAPAVTAPIAMSPPSDDAGNEQATGSDGLNDTSTPTAKSSISAEPKVPAIASLRESSYTGEEIIRDVIDGELQSNIKRGRYSWTNSHSNTNQLQVGVTSDHEDYYLNYSGPVEHTMCAFDPTGKGGPFFRLMQNYKTEVSNWGINISLAVYTDEHTASRDFESGLCNMISIPGSRARSYNSFTGTIDSYGSVTTYSQLRVLLKAFSSAKVAKFMISNEYETIATIPTGAVFAFLSDRSTRTESGYDEDSDKIDENTSHTHHFSNHSSMWAIEATLSQPLAKFQNGGLDVVAAPALFFEAIEPYNDLDPYEGILDYPLMMSTLQIIARRDTLPENFGQFSRDFAQLNFESAMNLIRASEKAIPEQYWIHLTELETNYMDEEFRRYRLNLRDKGIYDHAALAVLRKMRCSTAPQRSECELVGSK